MCEFGGRGNVQTLEEAAYAALRRLGMAEPERFNPWYYPGIAEYAGILEGCGMEVTFAHLFDRPTRLEHGERGLENWFRMFGGRLLEPLDEASHAEFFRLVEEHAAPRLKRDGHWTADYRRLRIAGRKPA